HLRGHAAGQFPIARVTCGASNGLQGKERLCPFVGAGCSSSLTDGGVERHVSLLTLAAPQKEFTLQDLHGHSGESRTRRRLFQERESGICFGGALRHLSS